MNDKIRKRVLAEVEAEMNRTDENCETDPVFGDYVEDLHRRFGDLISEWSDDVGLTTERVEPDRLWHVNVYERYRNFGGPEEGGWWYDSGVYQPQMSVTFVRSEQVVEDVNAYAVELQERLNREADEAGVPVVSSSVYNGGRYTVQTDDKPGADWPTERPHYE